MPHGAEDTVQHVIGSVILMPALDARHIARLGHHADGGLVAALACADGADLSLRQVLTDLAAVHAALRVQDGLGKGLRLRIREGKDVEGQALRALSPDAGQRGKAVDQIVKGCREKSHSLILRSSQCFHGWFGWQQRGPLFRRRRCRQPARRPPPLRTAARCSRQRRRRSPACSAGHAGRSAHGCG